MRTIALFIFLLYAASFGSVTLAGCGSTTTSGEDYGDILASPSGLELTESEHSYGWGKSDCSACHNLNNIHLGDSASGLIDMEAVRSTVADEGLSSCPTCHGTNGVE